MEAYEYDRMYQVEDEYFWYRTLRSIVNMNLNRIIKRLPGNHMLDGGCGTGALLKYLQKKTSFDRIGLDFSYRGLQFCRKRNTSDSLIQGTVNSLPFISDYFSLITSIDVLQHKEVQDVQALNEYYRVLQPGGFIMLNLPAYKSLFSTHDVAVQTVRRYRRKQVSKMLQKAGFRIQRITYWNTILFAPMALIRLLKRRHITEEHVNSDLDRINPVANGFFNSLLFLERGWLRFLNLPYGLSVFAVAQKPC